MSFCVLKKERFHYTRELIRFLVVYYILYFADNNMWIIIFDYFPIYESMNHTFDSLDNGHSHNHT